MGKKHRRALKARRRMNDLCRVFDRGPAVFDRKRRFWARNNRPAQVWVPRRDGVNLDAFEETYRWVENPWYNWIKDRDKLSAMFTPPMRQAAHALRRERSWHVINAGPRDDGLIIVDAYIELWIGPDACSRADRIVRQLRKVPGAKIWRRRDERYHIGDGVYLPKITIRVEVLQVSRLCPKANGCIMCDESRADWRVDAVCPWIGGRHRALLEERLEERRNAERAGSQMRI
jgi:hypothetical protein